MAGSSDESRKRLLRALGAMPPTLPASPQSVADFAKAFAPPKPAQPITGLGNVFGGFAPTPFGFVPSPPTAGVALLLDSPVKKRKAFFSFHYDDVMRVNVVRNAWKIDHPDRADNRSFYDSSLWESRKLEGDDALKRLIREGVCYTSAVCVLIGTQTWSRRWVKYEIARAIIDGRGLVAVHLNSINHHQRRVPDLLGTNPLAYMAVGKVQASAAAAAKYYLFELRYGWDAGAWGWFWFRYEDYTAPVDLPLWLTDPAPGYVTPLAQNAAVHDYILDNGHKNIGAWIDKAALRAGR